MKRFNYPKYKLLNNIAINEQIYTYIKDLIINNIAIPGTALSENEIAAHFNVSRQPVRDAITRLKRDDLIEIIPQRGTFVKKISVPDLHGICFSRCSIECNAVYESLRIKNKDFLKIVNKLKENIYEQNKLTGENMYIRFLQLDDEFHKLICSFSGTDFAWNMIQNVKANMDRIRFFSLQHISNPANLIKDHENILKHIEDKDFFQSTALLRNHIYEITFTYTKIKEENSEWFY